LVVDADNKIAAVAVQTDGLHHQQWLISDGLRGGEKVIVANVATLQVGSTVIPQLQPATAMATATAAATTTTTAAQGS
jgi:membrane fusion protein (multidrug efflux system)